MIFFNETGLFILLDAQDLFFKLLLNLANKTTNIDILLNKLFKGRHFLHKPLIVRRNLIYSLFYLLAHTLKVEYSTCHSQHVNKQ